MTDIWQVLALTLAAGVMIPAGGLLAHYERLRQGHLRDDLLAGVVAFGGGALLAAVVLLLIPEALEYGAPLLLVGSFLAGALVALWGNHIVERRGTKMGQLGAMLFDFVPESLALGAVAATGAPGALLLALLIGLQNLPEGFNAYREMCNSDRAKWDHGPGLILLGAVALVGPAAGWIGFHFIAGDGPLLAAILMAAAGGILALVFSDIAPLAHRSMHPAPTMGMVLGFGLGLTGLLFL